MKELIQLYLAFFRIGGLTFGGGLAMLPMLKHELVEKKQWVTEEEILDYYAIGQCTPGIIAVNVSTFVGYKRKGILGAIFSTLGMISPSLIIISILAMFLQQFLDNKYVAHAVGGIKVVVCALMLNTVITLGKKSFVNAISRGNRHTWISLASLLLFQLFSLLSQPDLQELFCLRQVKLSYDGISLSLY